jgi:hypothetical protein
MAWIILDTSCGIGGQPFAAGPVPIQVSEVDAKTLISMRYARPAEAPTPPAQPDSKQPKRPAPPPSSEP